MESTIAPARISEIVRSRPLRCRRSAAGIVARIEPRDQKPLAEVARVALGEHRSREAERVRVASDTDQLANELRAEDQSISPLLRPSSSAVTRRRTRPTLRRRTRTRPSGWWT